MTNLEAMEQLQRGDNVLLRYIDDEDDSTEMAVVLDVNTNRILFKNIDGKFEFTKKYLAYTNSIEMEIIEES